MWTAVLLKVPMVGEVWIKYQVAQFSRVLGTLLVGGIPLLQALDTAASFAGHAGAEKQRWQKPAKMVREGPGAFGSRCAKTGFSRAFHRHDRSGRIHRRAAANAGERGGILRRRRQHPDDGGASLIEPAIMICMGVFRGVRTGFAVSADLLVGGHTQMKQADSRNSEFARGSNGC